MNLGVCAQDGVGVEGKKVRCSFNDCLWNDKNKANCSEQACQTEDFGIGELWDVERKVLQEYLKENYRVIILTFVAFWYFFTIFVPYLTTGKLGDLHFGFFENRWNCEYELQKEFIDKCLGSEKYASVINELTRGSSVKMNEKLSSYYFDLERNKVIQQASGIQLEIEGAEKEMLDIIGNGQDDGNRFERSEGEVDYVDDKQNLSVVENQGLGFEIKLESVDGRVLDKEYGCESQGENEGRNEGLERETEKSNIFHQRYIDDKIQDGPIYDFKYFRGEGVYNEGFLLSGFAILQLMLNFL